MSTPRKARTATSASKLPPITVGKLEEIAKLIERVVEANQALFVSKGQAYKEIHREGASRPLTALEAADVAIALDNEDKIAEAEHAQQTLRMYDEPDAREILLQAGLATAPAFMGAVRQVVALVEMPTDEFEAACEEDDLEGALEAPANELRKLDIGEARRRAAAAFAHFAKSAGFEPGEAWRLPVQAVRQALEQAMSSLVDVSASSQLIDSATSTAGADETSSTDSGGPRRSS